MRIGAIAAFALGVRATLVLADTPASIPIKIAVFDFELEDDSPAAALLNEGTSSAAALERASAAARRELTQSGRYSVVDTSKVDAKPARTKTLRTCDGCEAGIASQLGADESLLGIVKRATQTDYYVLIEIREARTGKILEQQGANFAGGEEGWASGVRMLIKHQILATRE